MVRDGEEPGATVATTRTEPSYRSEGSRSVKRLASSWSDRRKDRGDMRPREIHTSLLKHRLSGAAEAVAGSDRRGFRVQRRVCGRARERERRGRERERDSAIAMSRGKEEWKRNPMEGGGRQKHVPTRPGEWKWRGLEGLLREELTNNGDWRLATFDL